VNVPPAVDTLPVTGVSAVQVVARVVPTWVVPEPAARSLRRRLMAYPLILVADDADVEGGNDGARNPLWMQDRHAESVRARI
jgi:hypothetical protein